MRTLCSSVLLVAALGFFSVGCQGAPEDLEGDISDAIAARPQSGNGGTGGPNSYFPHDFMEFGGRASQALAQPLLWPGKEHEISSGVAGLLMAWTGGKSTFKYAASCALPAGEYASYDDTDFPGLGFIKGGDDWLSGSTKKETRYGVLTCMAARLNPYGVVVPILEVGPLVAHDGITVAADYPFREMVISVVDDPIVSNKLVVNVWPLEDLSKACGVWLEGSLGTRLCDDDPTSCGLVHRQDIQTACVDTAMGWWCDGLPAIETRLRVIDLPTLHPGCDAP